MTVALGLAVAPGHGPARAESPPALLGTADSFAVLGGSTITNSGPTVFSGDLGLYPGTAVVGFPPGTVNGAQHISDAAANQAKTDLTTAYTDVAGRPFSATSPPDIGGRTLTAGVYRTGSEASLGLTGRLTLDAQGDPRAAFIFQIASTLLTASDSSVRLINGAQACNVYWQVGSSATLGTGTAFQGNILALTSISVNDGVAVNGRLLARNGAVTLMNDTVRRSRCAAGTGTGRAAPALKALDVRLSKPAVIGRDTAIVVEATDAHAPVNGMSVQFGRTRDVFGSSACRPLDSQGNLPPAFGPGRRTRLAAPHRFHTRGKQNVVVRVDTGGCASTPTSVYQTVTVTPTRPGERPRPLIVAAPTLVKPPGSLIPPILPASSISGRGVPVAGSASSGVARSSRAGRQCASASRRIRRSAKSLRAARKSLLCLLNAQRRARGLRPLRADRRLLKAAERHSRSMVVRRYFSHVEPGGLGMFDRVTRSGYLRRVRNWSIGENIGYGHGSSSSPAGMTRSWMASTPHRHNILTAKFREVGLGIVPGVPGRSGRGATYTTDFGHR